MSEEIPRGRIFVPGEIDGTEEWLRWKIPRVTSRHNWVRATDTTLERFARLQTAAEVLQFARRYGVFGAKQIVETAPRLPNELRLEASAGRWCVSLFGAGLTDREPVWIWLFLSRQVRAMLRINAGLKGRTNWSELVVGTDDDWRAVAGPGDPLTDVRDAQFFLMQAVNEWLRIGEVGLRLGVIEWSRTRTDWKIEVGYGDGHGYNLFGQLAYRLFVSVAGEDRLYACSGCGTLYIRLKKRPRAGQDNYCDDCTELAARRASQRWKARNRRG